MLSSNTSARLCDSEKAVNESATHHEPHCDSDTVRLVEIDLLGVDESEFKYWIVTWFEHGHQRPARRFWKHRDALIFSKRLKCRLNIDAYMRECVAAASEKKGRS